VKESHDYSKQLLARFIESRLQAKQTNASSTDPPSPGPEPAAGPQPDQSGLRMARTVIRRHNEATLPARVRYPFIGLESSN
jgi:hypothetical protein